MTLQEALRAVCAPVDIVGPLSKRPDYLRSFFKRYMAAVAFVTHSDQAADSPLSPREAEILEAFAAINDAPDAELSGAVEAYSARYATPLEELLDSTEGLLAMRDEALRQEAEAKQQLLQANTDSLKANSEQAEALHCFLTRLLSGNPRPVKGSGHLLTLDNITGKPFVTPIVLYRETRERTLTETGRIAWVESHLIRLISNGSVQCLDLRQDFNPGVKEAEAYLAMNQMVSGAMADESKSFKSAANLGTALGFLVEETVIHDKPEEDEDPPEPLIPTVEDRVQAPHMARALSTKLHRAVRVHPIIGHEDLISDEVALICAKPDMTSQALPNGWMLSTLYINRFMEKL